MLAVGDKHSIRTKEGWDLTVVYASGLDTALSHLGTGDVALRCPCSHHIASQPTGRTKVFSSEVSMPSLASF